MKSLILFLIIAFVSQIHCDCSDEKKSDAYKAPKAAVVGGTTAVVGTAAVNTVIGAVGFTKAGVLAGSVAAGVQSTIGSVAAGSLFAGLQSVAATGGLALMGPVGLGLGLAGGVGYYLFSSE